MSPAHRSLFIDLAELERGLFIERMDPTGEQFDGLDARARADEAVARKVGEIMLRARVTSKLEFDAIVASASTEELGEIDDLVIERMPNPWMREPPECGDDDFPEIGEPAEAHAQFENDPAYERYCVESSLWGQVIDVWVQHRA